MLEILIVDNDKRIRHYYSNFLIAQGYSTRMAESAEEAMNLLSCESFELIVLDVYMPGIDGYEFTKTLRDMGNTIPIIMVSAKGAQKNVNKGLSCGADDYLVKPVDEEEFILRIRNLLRRAKSVSSRELTVGSTKFECESHTVYENGVGTTLPSKEFELLYTMISYPNQIFSRNKLMDEVWGPASESSSATVSVHINRLRTKFSRNKDFSIQTIRGIGYKVVILAE